MTDSERDNRHDLAHEARTARPALWDRGDDQPDPSEYYDLRSTR